MRARTLAVHAALRFATLSLSPFPCVRARVLTRDALPRPSPERRRARFANGGDGRWRHHCRVRVPLSLLFAYVYYVRRRRRRAPVVASLSPSLSVSHVSAVDDAPRHQPAGRHVVLRARTYTVYISPHTLCSVSRSRASVGQVDLFYRQKLTALIRVYVCRGLLRACRFDDDDSSSSSTQQQQQRERVASAALSPRARTDDCLAHCAAYIVRAYANSIYTREHRDACTCAAYAALCAYTWSRHGTATTRAAPPRTRASLSC